MMTHCCSGAAASGFTLLLALGEAGQQLLLLPNRLFLEPPVHLQLKLWVRCLRNEVII